MIEKQIHKGMGDDNDFLKEDYCLLNKAS